MKSFAVIGNPVQHSLSPLIHGEFSRQTGIHLQYEKLFCEITQFSSTVDHFRERGGSGLNVTVPFKPEAFQYADHASARAERAKAANILKFSENVVVCDNVDGVGLVRDIQHNLHWQINDKSILLLGAGGAVRGVLYSLIEQAPKSLALYNRTIAKAKTLASEFADIFPIQVILNEQSLADHHFDILINGTSQGLAGSHSQFPEKINLKNTACYDMVYGQITTPFCQWAKLAGSNQMATGLGMLVEQAAESFYFWHGLRPTTQTLLQQLQRGVI